MKKGIARVTALVLAALIAVSCVYSALAASPTQDNKLVSVLGIMVGDENGNFDEDGYLTREQLAKITVAMGFLFLVASIYIPNVRPQHPTLSRNIISNASVI